MKLLIDSFDSLPKSICRSAVSIGNFDGVHRGHRRLADSLVQAAKKVDSPSIVFTFEPAPISLLAPQTIPAPLTWMQRRAQLLHDLGVDIVFAYPTTHEILSMTAEQFFHEILIQKLQCKAIVEGPNFRFGKGRLGDVAMLRQLCESSSIHFEVIPIEKNEEEWISSSRIRKLIQEGSIELANTMLTQPYRITGCVTTGAGRGRGLGFPTANLTSIPVLLPKIGVYAGRAIVQGQARRAAINIGPNPTFQESDLKVEAHFLDLQSDLVGQQIEVELLVKLRDVIKFHSVEELRNQLAIDLDRTRSLVAIDDIDNA